MVIPQFVYPFLFFLQLNTPIYILPSSVRDTPQEKKNLKLLYFQGYSNYEDKIYVRQNSIEVYFNASKFIVVSQQMGSRKAVFPGEYKSLEIRHRCFVCMCSGPKVFIRSSKGCSTPPPIVMNPCKNEEGCESSSVAFRAGKERMKMVGADLKTKGWR